MDYRDTRLAYTAGFIEADGCFHITNTGISLKATNVHRDTLLRFVDWHGGSIQQNGKKYTNWVLHGPEAASLCQRLIPFLNMKKRQASILLEFQETVGPRGRRISTEVQETRKRLREELRESRAY